LHQVSDLFESNVKLRCQKVKQGLIHCIQNTNIFTSYYIRHKKFMEMVKILQLKLYYFTTNQGALLYI